jgi:hypothetical protein
MFHYLQSLNLLLPEFAFFWIGYFLTFQGRDLLETTIARRRKASPTGRALFEGFLLSPFYKWFVRILGIIVMLMAVVLLLFQFAEVFGFQDGLIRYVVRIIAPSGD